MNNFIECYPQVLSRELCNNIIHEFNHDNYKKLGRLGGQVDHSRKHSTDVRCRFNNTLYQQYNNVIEPALKGGLQLYTGKYEFMMELSSWNISNWLISIFPFGINILIITLYIYQCCCCYHPYCIVLFI